MRYWRQKSGDVVCLPQMNEALFSKRTNNPFAKKGRYIAFPMCVAIWSLVPAGVR